MASQTDLCICDHTRAAHFEESPGCSLGDCECEEFRLAPAQDFTDPFYTLGRIQGVVEMLDKPDIYRLSTEQGIERIREIVAQYKLNRAVSRG